MAPFRGHAVIDRDDAARDAQGVEAQEAGGGEARQRRAMEALHRRIGEDAGFAALAPAPRMEAGESREERFASLRVRGLDRHLACRGAAPLRLAPVAEGLARQAVPEIAAAREGQPRTGALLRHLAPPAARRRRPDEGRGGRQLVQLDRLAGARQRH